MRISDWRSDVCSSDLGTIVLIELARQLQRGGVAVACGQRLEVDRSQRRFLHDVQQALLGPFETGQERDHHAEPALARLAQLLEAVEATVLKQRALLAHALAPAKRVAFDRVAAEQIGELDTD